MVSAFVDREPCFLKEEYSKTECCTVWAGCFYQMEMSTTEFSKRETYFWGWFILKKKILLFLDNGKKEEEEGKFSLKV